jgi:hypothetical protein
MYIYECILNEDATNVLTLDCQVGRQICQYSIIFTETVNNLKHTKIASNSSMSIFSLVLYYAILCTLHIKIELTTFFCHKNFPSIHPMALHPKSGLGLLY